MVKKLKKPAAKSGSTKGKTASVKAKESPVKKAKPADKAVKTLSKPAKTAAKPAKTAAPAKVVTRPVAKTTVPSAAVKKEPILKSPEVKSKPLTPETPTFKKPVKFEQEDRYQRRPSYDRDDDDGEERASADSAEDRTPVVKPVGTSSDLFTEAELDVFRKMLTEERAKILTKAKQAMASGNIHIDKDEMYDEVDMASATIEQNLTFRLLDRDRKLLAEIDHAIAKLENGDFGYCEGTGEPIPKRRLELRPWCRHSVKFKEQLERMKKSGRGVVDEDEVF